MSDSKDQKGAVSRIPERVPGFQPKGVEPKPDQVEAMKSAEAFFEGVMELRAKFGIANGVVAISIPYGDSDPETGGISAAAYMKAFGEGHAVAEVTALAYRNVVVPILSRAERLAQIPSSGPLLTTDPPPATAVPVAIEKTTH